MAFGPEAERTVSVGVTDADGPGLAAIVARVATGDAEAMLDLVSSATKLVHGPCRRVLGAGADADDVTQEVFVQAWKQAGRFDPERGQPRSWLQTLARSRAIDRLRARHRLQRRTVELHVAVALPSPVEDPEAASLKAQEGRRLRTALASLPPAQRRALELAYFEDLTAVEIAARLSAPVGTVKSRVRAGLQGLRKAFRVPLRVPAEHATG